jgi:hypothetical protein
VTAVTTPTRAPTRPQVDEGLDQRTEERPASTDAGDHDRFAHYVRKRDLERSRQTGKPVRALCGKRWKPDRDPSQYPMCPTCAEIVAEAMSRGLGS